jgi:N-acetylglutamate synthase-like GNAT family acetyltransferase
MGCKLLCFYGRSALNGIRPRPLILALSIIRITRDKEMIRNAAENDFEEIYNIINDAAIAYKGIIPADRWHEPYMTKEELKKQIEDGVRFSCYLNENKIVGVMGIQDKKDVTLIRHAYVATKERKKGIGTLLLQKLIKDSEKPILIGTWKAAHWAISFYEKHGFSLVSEEEKDSLLRKYWDIPTRQIETSVVLADTKSRVP